ncbi:hypothetical protein ACSNOI_17020 [Actinomadura kijaniata]|uniref:hypothetical protein n=1 Tax=Actinomadura kijaniata TaxID=46161 RepID=UPI003F1BF072
MLLIGILVATGCGDSKKKTPPPSPTSAPPPASPTYTAEQVKQRMIATKEVSPKARETSVVLDELKDDRALICSMTGFKFPGDPSIVKRQIVNPSKGQDQFQYAQIFALYNNKAAADSAYSALQKKAESCPSKRRVPPKKVRENFTILGHQDTWKAREEPINGWTRLRGVEQQVVPPTATKFNVYHFMYDYAVRGNLVVATMYVERREPKKPADPVAERATELLTKQLQKLG